jgi:tRNA U55 pseudouridine synthase TruB
MEPACSRHQEYLVTGKFGISTDSMDCTGKEEKEMPFDHITLEKLNGVLPKYRGKIQQVPPA